MGENDDICTAVFPVTRNVPGTLAVGSAALGELLKGPNTTEQAAGYGTSLPSGVRLVSLRISRGVATADFSDELNRVGGSCRVTAIRKQITETLRQFPTVSSTIISVSGRTEDVLQP